MKKTGSFIFFSCLVLFVSAQNNVSAYVEELKQTDLAFSKLCVEKGMKVSFVEYADSNVIKLSNKDFAIRGKAELEKKIAEQKDDFKLEWKPDFAEAAKSGDLGYTFGNWRLTKADGKLFYGNYMTVWKRQADGSWKYVMDAGNATPDNPDLWK